MGIEELDKCVSRGEIERYEILVSGGKKKVKIVFATSRDMSIPCNHVPYSNITLVVSKMKESGLELSSVMVGSGAREILYLTAEIVAKEHMVDVIKKPKVKARKKKFTD